MKRDWQTRSVTRCERTPEEEAELTELEATHATDERAWADVLAAKGTGKLRPRLSEAERRDRPSEQQLGVFLCKYGSPCLAKCSSQANLRQHYKRVQDAITSGKRKPCNCPGPSAGD